MSSLHFTVKWDISRIPKGRRPLNCTLQVAGNWGRESAGALRRGFSVAFGYGGGKLRQGVRRCEGGLKKKATAKKPTPLEDRYPNITEWLSGGGRVELGPIDMKNPFVRAVDDGATVWEGGGTHPSLDEAFDQLEAGLKAFFDAQGFWEGEA